MSMFGLEYNNLIRLSESGLVRPSFTEWQELTPLIYDGTIVLDHADIKLFLRRDGSEHSKQLNSNIRLTGPALTSVGTELRRVVTMTHSPEYLKALARWFKARHLDLYRATEQDGERLRGEKIDSL